jgi:hypothetical protein
VALVIDHYRLGMRRILPVVLVTSFVLAACGGSEASSVEATTVAPTSLSADADGAGDAGDAVAAATETSAADPDTGENAETGATDASGPLVAPIELDPCLVGTWTVSLETISLLIAAAILPVPDLTVPRGGFTVVLNDDGSVLGDADFTGAFTLGESSAEADVRWTGSGTWFSTDGTVTLSLDEQEGGLTEVRLAGEVQPGSQIDADIPLAGGPYTCSDDRLEVTGSAGETTIPLILER